MARLAICWMFVVCLALAACGPETIVVRPSLDTADRHTANGYTLLDQGKADDAWREFRRANELDPKNVEALIGLSLALGQRGEIELGTAALDQAGQVAVTDQERTAIQKGYTQFREIIGDRGKVPFEN